MNHRGPETRLLRQPAWSRVSVSPRLMPFNHTQPQTALYVGSRRKKRRTVEGEFKDAQTTEGNRAYARGTRPPEPEPRGARRRPLQELARRHLPERGRQARRRELGRALVRVRADGRGGGRQA